eukprot:5016571-Ditylum_brightwellii.AAC.1
MVSSVSGLTMSMNQTLQDIFQRTEAVKQAYQNEKATLQQLQDTTSTLQKNTTVQDNLEKCFKESEKKTKKRFGKQEERIDEKFKDISTTMEKNQETIMTAIQSKNSD